MKKNSLKKPNAFSLIEVLIVVAIIALLFLAAVMSFRSQRQKAEDVRVKTDLSRLKVAFENYYNDNNCYPPTDWFDNPTDCGSNLLSPYLSSIPCDPKTNRPYQLEQVGGQCGGFRLYATLQISSDPAVTGLCVSSGGSSLGNYGVSSSNTTVGINCSLAPSPSATASVLPTSSPSTGPTLPPNASPGPYACQYNICNNFGYPNGCSVSFSNEEVCESYCTQEGSITCFEP